MSKLSANVRASILCGPIPVIRNWKKLKLEELTRGERVLRFITEYCRIPEGKGVGDPLVLDEFQIAFILAIYDNPKQTRRAALSIARKNGKSALIAAIALAHVCGPEAQQNSQIITAALSREQAALIFTLASKMVHLHPQLDRLCRDVPSTKRIYGLSKNVEFKSIARDATGASTQGLSPVLCIVDESGQVKGIDDAYITALTSSQGAHEAPLFMTISTQSPSDADWLSVFIDDSVRASDPHTVTHLYSSANDAEMLDEKEWIKANPALGKFRNYEDLKQQLEKAARLPALSARALNLLLNRRVALESLFLSPEVWKLNKGDPDINIFKEGRVIAGLDLSARNDLTACVLAARDAMGNVHTIPFVFCPTQGIEERADRDRAPYAAWVKSGDLIPIGGAVMDYEQIASYLKMKTKEMGIKIDEIHFDRWHIQEWKSACEREKAFPGAEWVEVGQGYKDMGPRCDTLLNNMLSARIRHGNHPLLVMSAANAIAVPDPTGAVKLDKRKSTQRIDPLVAMLMACYPLLDGDNGGYDVNSLIG